MDNRKFQAAAIATPPAAEASPSTGYPTDGNPAGGVPATVPGAAWFNQIGEELRAVLTAAGITPDHTNLTQLLTALQALFAAKAGSVSQVFTSAGGSKIGAAPTLGEGFAIKESSATAYGLIIESSVGDKWLRLGHDGTNGFIETTFNVTGPAGNLILSQNASSGTIIELTPTEAKVTGKISPSAHNTYDLGTTAVRWKDLWLQSGAFNGSDARLKTPVAPLASNEINASKQIAKEIGTYQWLESIQVKGAAARHHIGLTVQRAIEIMQANGLDPFAYGFIGYDQWLDVFVEHPVVEAAPAKPEEPAIYETVIVNTVIMIDGEAVLTPRTVLKEIKPAVPAQPAVEARPAWTEQTQQAGDAFSFRYDQLNMFIAAGLEARISMLESAA